MSGVRAGRVVKLKSGRRLKARPVLRMMAIMQEGNNEEIPKEFVEGGRTGRRNAMPDILHSADAHASTADLPSRLQQLATDEGDSAHICPRSSGHDIDSQNEVRMSMFLRSKELQPTMPILACSCSQTTVESVELDVRSSVLDDSSCHHKAQLNDYLDMQPARQDYCKRGKDGRSCRDIGTTVSETSWKYCCSSERLKGYLNLDCARRRNAIPVVTKNACTSCDDDALMPGPIVYNLDYLESQDSLEGMRSRDHQNYIVLVEVPKEGDASVVYPGSRVPDDLDIRNAALMAKSLHSEELQLLTPALASKFTQTSDPDNPQPGPSSVASATTTDDKKEGTEKKDSVS